MAVQDIVLGGFGSTGTASLIVTSGFSGGAVVAVAEHTSGGGTRRKVKQQLPPHLRPPLFLEEKKKKEPEVVLTELPEPRNPVLANSLRKAQLEKNWKPVSVDMARVLVAINKPLPVFKEKENVILLEKKKEFSVEDDDDEVIFLMYG